MRPDQRWFPTNRIDRAGWFYNFAAKFTLIGIELGFTPDEIEVVNADNRVLQLLSATLLQTENYLKKVQAFQKTITLARNGSATPDFPIFDPPNIPPMPPAGIFERLERLVRRIRVAPGYSESIGASLGIIPKAAKRADLAETSPVIKASTAATGYLLVVQTSRRNFSGFTVEGKRNRSETWELLGKFVRSPAEVVVAPQKPGEPEMIEVRIRMLKGNDPVGRYSDTQTVVLLP